MSIPKRGSRTLVVDDVRYRWRLRGRPTAAQRSGDTPLIVAIAAAEGDGPALVVRQLVHPAAARVRNHYTRAVTPAEVAGYVRQGLAAGWRPLEPGPQFDLEPLLIPVSPRAPRIYPPGLAPPSSLELAALARERATGRVPYDTLRVSDGDPRVYGGLLEINGRNLIDLVREVERPLMAAEVAERRAAGEDLPTTTDFSRQYCCRFSSHYRLPSRLLLGEPPPHPVDAFALDPEDPARRKSALLVCSCGFDECWFVLATIDVLDDAVIWSDFEQFHRNWVYDLGPFVF
ncbi:MAG: hypothetical protein KC486_32085, partial [Myxococcales bacterium]|nr:hypothetical protein [Myxococcales bacterium]